MFDRVVSALYSALGLLFELVPTEGFLEISQQDLAATGYRKFILGWGKPVRDKEVEESVF